MKLGLVLYDYFPFGGLQRDCLKTALQASAAGHDVTIFTRTWTGDRPGNIAIELFGKRGLTNVSRNERFVHQLASALPRHGLDGVIGFIKVPGLDVYYGADPCFAAKVVRLKSRWYRWTRRYRHYRTMEESVFQRGADTAILLLTGAEIPAYENFYGTERERFHLLPPGIVRRHATPEKRDHAAKRIRQEHGWGADEHLLLLVGSGFRTKGLDRAIRSLAALPMDRRQRTRLVIIGQDRPREFERLADKLGVARRIHFLGGRNDVFDYMLAADLLVHPAYSEAAGMVLLEALTAGLPVLATDVCGYAFHIAQAAAGRVLRSPFNQADCDRAVANMLVSLERSTWQNNALHYAHTEDLYSCHKRAVQIIEKVISSKRRNK